MKRAADYLTVEEKDGQLEATLPVGDHHETGISNQSLSLAKLSQVQQMLNVSKAEFKPRATNSPVSTGLSERKN